MSGLSDEESGQGSVGERGRGALWELVDLPLQRHCLTRQMFQQLTALLRLLILLPKLKQYHSNHVKVNVQHLGSYNLRWPFIRQYLFSLYYKNCVVFWQMEMGKEETTIGTFSSSYFEYYTANLKITCVKVGGRGLRKIMYFPQKFHRYWSHPISIQYMPRWETQDIIFHGTSETNFSFVNIECLFFIQQCTAEVALTGRHTGLQVMRESCFERHLAAVSFVED